MIRYITSGESHGKAMCVTIEGIPAGLSLDENFINKQLARRQQGYGRGGRMKIETDKAEVITGVRNNKTIGSPITLIVWNKDWENWKNTTPEPVLKPRPGHADLTGAYKYNMLADIRNVLERSSARETAARVAGTAVARLFLNELGIDIFSHIVNFGSVKIDTTSLSYDEIKSKAYTSDIACACTPDVEKTIKDKIDQCKKNGDTLGGVIEIVIRNIPPFLGSYQSHNTKLDAQLAQTVLSLQAIKGIEFGMGFDYANNTGKNAHDEIYFDETKKQYYRKTNRAGGIEGGMSNGNPLIFRAVMKPIPTLMTPLDTVNIATQQAEKAVKERSDITAVPAAGVVLENIIAVDIANAIIVRYGGDNMNLIKQAIGGDKYLGMFSY